MERIDQVKELLKRENVRKVIVKSSQEYLQLLITLFVFSVTLCKEPIPFAIMKVIFCR